ncbi:MAG: hypothetical protein ACE5HA_05040 [Anaerolineae bacterium]
MVNLGQISRLVVLVVAGWVLTARVDLPAWTLPLIVLDSPLTLRFSGAWLVAFVLVILVSAGTDGLLRLQPARVEAGYRQTAPAWVLPGIAAGAPPLLLVKFQPLSAPWFLLLAGAGIGLVLVLLAEAHAADPSSRFCPAARAGLAVLAYAAALLAFTAIYSLHMRTVLSGTATTLLGFALALALLRWSAGPTTRIWPHAAVTAVLVGLATWVLNHKPVDSLAGGGLLLLVFYVATGFAQQLIQRNLSRRVLIEFAVAVALGLLILIGFSGRGG